MNQANSTKLIPYGMTDFPAIIRNNYYYVDKTEYIRQIEQTARFFFFVRPRRFGKSLFLNMLECYYDCKTEKQFDELFGNLYVGKHPTPDRNKYLVLKMSFSSIVSDPEKMEASFNSNCDMIFTDFCLKYADLLPPDTLEMVQQKEVASEKLTAVCLSLRRQGLKMYLILDEYDNFANNVLVNYGNTRYRSLTHGDGFLRNFLKTVKDYTDRVVERMYITGVSPVTMDDLTSGFNIASNQSTNPVFNNMIGFTEAEVRELLEYYRQQGKIIHPVDELISMMKPWYDNYCFSGRSLKELPMYNSDMVLYFVNSYLSTQLPPENMLDTNCRTDYNKLRHLILIDKNFGKNASIIQEIITQGETVGRIKESFPAVEIAQTDNFKSLLFYYGMLTITATRGQRMVLSIPNNNVRKQYYEFMLEEYQERRYIDLNSMLDLFYDMAYDGHWRESLEFIAHAYKENSSVRSAIEGERNIQGFFTAYLSVNAYYLLAPELELNHGFCDLFLMPDLLRYEVAHSYIIELKYLSSKDSESKTETQWQEAVGQVRMYAAAPKVKQLIQNTQLHCIVVQFRGCELERMEEVSF